MQKKSVEYFTAQQKVKKSQFRSRNWGNVHSAQKQGISPVCSIIYWTLDSMFAHRLVAVEWDLRAHSVEVSAPTSILEKAQTKCCLITSRHMSKVQEVKKQPSTKSIHDQGGVAFLTMYVHRLKCMVAFLTTYIACTMHIHKAEKKSRHIHT